MPKTKKVTITEGEKAYLKSSFVNFVSQFVWPNTYPWLPFVIGLIIIFSSKGLNSPNLFSLACFVSGFSGVIIAVRREIPVGLSVISGPRALIEGILVTLLCWGGGLYIFLSQGR